VDRARVLHVKAGEFMLAEGPLRVKLLEGEASICGARCREGYEFLLVAEKAVTVEALTDLRLEVHGGLEAKLEKSEKTVPEEWLSVVEELAKGRGTVMLVGHVDSGKTFMATYIANKLVDEGFKVAVVDSDVGQSSIGPPATIGMAVMEKPEPFLNELKMEAGYFVGSTTPTGHLLPMVVGVRKLVDRARQVADCIVIDTTGMVFGGPARALKLYKAEVVRPDIAVLLERRGELSHLAKQLEALGIEVRRIPASRWVKPRGRGERRALRERAFQVHFKRRKPREVELDLTSTPLIGTYLGSGVQPSGLREEVKALLGVEVLYCESLPEGIVAIIEEKVAPRQVEVLRRRFGETIKLLRKGFEKGLLVGLLDSEGLLLDVGVVKRLELEKSRATVTTPLEDLGYVRAVKLGSIRLNEEYEEVESLRPGFL